MMQKNRRMNIYAIDIMLIRKIPFTATEEAIASFFLRIFLS